MNPEPSDKLNLLNTRVFSYMNMREGAVVNPTPSVYSTYKEIRFNE